MDGSDGIECGYMRAMFEFDLESFFSFFFSFFSGILIIR